MVYPYLNAFAIGMGVELRTISLAVTARSAVGVMGPFLGILADSRGRKFGMIFGLLLFTTGVGLMAVFPAFPIFILSLILTLLGNLVFIPSMQAYLGDRVVYSRRGRALAVTELSWSLSILLFVPVVGIFIARGHWQTPFPILTLLGVVSIAVLFFILPRDRAPQTDNRKSTPFANLKRVFLYYPAVAGLFMGVSMSAANEMVNITFAIWMKDAFQVQIAALAVASLIIGLSELVGEGLVGIFSDRIGKARAISAGLILNGLAVALLPVIGRDLVGGLVGLAFFYLTFEFAIVSSIPLMTEVLPAARATLMASWIASISGGRALGALVASGLYESTLAPGIVAIIVAVIALNLLAMIALGFVRKSFHLGQSQGSS